MSRRRKIPEYDDDCSLCIHDDKSPNDDPCYKCLSGYFGKPNFVRKEPEKRPRHVDEYTQLPWYTP